MKKRIQSSAAVDSGGEPITVPVALLAPLIRALQQAQGESPSLVLQPAANPGDDRKTVAKRRALEERSARLVRANFFPPVIFAEPGWEILLLLFVQRDGADALTVTEVSELTNIRLTTAIRWIEYLEVSKLVTRVRLKSDRRAKALTLTALADERLTNYFGRAPLCTDRSVLSG